MLFFGLFFLARAYNNDWIDSIMLILVPGIPISYLLFGRSFLKLKENFPFSRLANKKVNTLIFPNLESANITYKLLKELNKAESIGPIMMGLRKPVHILQLGASVDEIVNMTAVAVVDAQQKGKTAN